MAKRKVKGVIRWIERTNGIVQRYHILNVKEFNKKYKKTKKKSKTGAAIWKKEFFDYKIVIYFTEDTMKGTGTKLEMTISSWKTKLTEEQIMDDLLDELAEILKDAVGVSGSDWGDVNIGHFDVKPAKKAVDRVDYVAVVLNIGHHTSMKKLQLEGTQTEGFFLESEITSRH